MPKSAILCAERIKDFDMRSRISPIRIHSYDMLRGHNVEHDKSVHVAKSEPPPIELSDVVWRATKAVEEADRPKAKE